MSPLPELDPFTGDVVYSQALLEQPPPGIVYVRYDDALASGELVEHGRRAAIEKAHGTRATAVAWARLIREHAINDVRLTGLLFREPFRTLEIRGDFDLVHCHTYSARWLGEPTPVLVSNAIPLSELYARARGWGSARVRCADDADRALARILGITHIEHGLAHADRFVAFTHKLKAWYVDQGVPPDRIGVVPCFPAEMPDEVTADRVPGRIGFVAGDFRAKGGDTVVRAMALVRAVRPEAHLWVGGGTAPSSTLDGITWQGYVDRRKLLTEFFPSCEAFAYPSRFDGLPLTLLEAMGSGLPTVVSDYFALPEVVGTGGGGRVVPQNDPRALADALLELLDPKANAAASAAIRSRYESTYAPEVVLPNLRTNYELAISAAAPRLAAARREAGANREVIHSDTTP